MTTITTAERFMLIGLVTGAMFALFNANRHDTPRKERRRLELVAASLVDQAKRLNEVAVPASVNGIAS